MYFIIERNKKISGKGNKLYSIYTTKKYEKTCYRWVKINNEFIMVSKALSGLPYDYHFTFYYDNDTQTLAHIVDFKMVVEKFRKEVE